MKLLAGLSIRGKLLSAFAAMAFTTLALGVFAIERMASINRSAVEIHKNWLPAIGHLCVAAQNAEQYRVLEAVPQPSPHFFSCDSKAVGLDAKSPRHLQREAGPTDRVIPRVT